MAQVSFEVKYYFDAKGLDWADIPDDNLNEIIENCRSGIILNFDSPLKPADVEINGVDNYSEIPSEAKDAGYDSFAEVQLIFDVDDSILEELEIEILEESESYSGDIDSLFGSGVFEVASGLIIGKPEQVWVEETN